MVLNDALEVLSTSLKQDKRVQAIFVKGSVGRGEQDEHSDLDLYCLVEWLVYLKQNHLTEPYEFEWTLLSCILKLENNLEG